MDSITKQILQKFSTQKVELSSLKQIKDAISNLKNQENDADKVATKFEAKIKEASAAYDLVLKERNAIYTWVMREAPARISDFDKVAKELGYELVWTQSSMYNPENVSLLYKKI